MEFVIVLPMMILFFGIIVEFGRLYWGYQSVVAGVRDASRYLGRMAPVEVCIDHPGGGELLQYVTGVTAADLRDRVRYDRSSVNLLPVQFTVNSVGATYACEDAPSTETWEYRTPEIPLATVTANVTMQFPLGHLFSLFGPRYTSITTDVSDDARIFGS
ncbi:MAG: pilus assembly protein [Maritimibacter sp.]|nr:pilus assembly protein [Maritimibacter sp.]